MKIFLAGATTEIGARAARILAEHGHHIRALYHNALNLGEIPKHERIEPVFGDLNEPESALVGLIGDAEAIISTVHLRLTVRLAKALTADKDTARWQYTPLVAISSARIHTRLKDDPSANELRDLEAALGALPFCSLLLRPTMIYGVRKRGVLATYERWIERGWPIPIVAGGRRLIQPVWAGDVAAAIVAGLARLRDIRPNFSSKNATEENFTSENDSPITYDIGGGEPISVREVVHRLAREHGKKARLVPLPAQMIATLLGALRLKPGVRLALLRQTEDRIVEIQSLKTDLEILPVGLREGRKLLFKELEGEVCREGVLHSDGER